MTWLPIILLAALAFAVAAFALRLPRYAWTLFGATLLFGLAGYALQGSPGQSTAPAVSREQASQDGEILVNARREFYGNGLPSRFVITADAFARRGDYEQAANFLRNAVAENPNDDEAWLALGNALVEHAEGQLTAPALEAFARGDAVRPGQVAPTYFLGLAYLREGQAGRTLDLWRGLLDEAPADAEWREALGIRVARLETMLGIEPSTDGAETER